MSAYWSSKQTIKMLDGYISIEEYEEEQDIYKENLEHCLQEFIDCIDVSGNREYTTLMRAKRLLTEGVYE